jgi:plasmid stability protein
MDRTIRNLDEDAYRKLKARAALGGKTVGELINQAIRAYLARPDGMPKSRSLGELRPEAYLERDDRLSEEIDAVVYGV